MKRLLFISIGCGLILIACRRDNGVSKPKETDEDSILLTLTVDSSFYAGVLQTIDRSEFQFDNVGRLHEWRFYRDSVTNGNSYSQLVDFTRDDKERVIKITRNNYGFVNQESLPKTPAVITDYYYVGSSENVIFGYQYNEGKESATGDSITFTYSGSNIIDRRSYDLSNPYPVYSLIETIWTYDNAGHLTTSAGQLLDSRTTGTYSFTFDDKVNPLPLGTEAMLVGILRMSAGNVVNIRSVNLYGYENVETTQYTYRDYNRPVRATVSNSGNPVTRIISYSYSR